jgi:hypothetical protein
VETPSLKLSSTSCAISAKPTSPNTPVAPKAVIGPTAAENVPSASTVVGKLAGAPALALAATALPSLLELAAVRTPAFVMA